MALDLTLCYLTADDCTEVFARAGGYVFTASTVPTLTQVEGYVYDAASLIEAQTEKAGLLTSPPASGITPTRLKRNLLAANAIGAAYMARLQMYVYNQDEASLRVAQALAALWITYMGEGSVAISNGSLASLGNGTGGLIFDTITAVSGSDVHASDVTEGDVTLPTVVSAEVTPPFTMDEVD